MKVIIVGAGASGLMAAYELTRNGAEVIMLEAENRIGGRIQTVTPPGFVHEVEAGAEFIHGDLPLTLGLMKKANLSYVKTGGAMYHAADGKIERGFAQGVRWNEFYDKLESVRHNFTLAEFLDKYFSQQEYAKLRKEAFAMAQGLDLADPAQLSVISIKKEWLSDETQYRPVSGYQPLLSFLYDQCTVKKFTLLLNETVRKIDWVEGEATAYTQNSSFVGDAVLLTLPVWRFTDEALEFSPKIQAVQKFNEIGYGGVIKMAFEFDHPFWEDSVSNMGFLFADEFTFWTQLTIHKPVLVVWIGNQHAHGLEKIADNGLVQLALEKLQSCFTETDIRKQFRAGAVFRFTQNSRMGGGYSWLKPGSKKAIAELNKGVAKTIWFAGEALDRGEEPGTVDAALRSGRYTARKILKAMS